MNRSPQTRTSTFSSVCAIALLGLALPIAVCNADQQTAAERVNSLRSGLRQNQQDYLAALAGRHSPKPTASDYVSFLRSDLKEQVARLIDAAGGGEVELSLRRSAVRIRLDAIHAYEDALGDRRLPRTTEWNVFSSEELAAIRHDAQSNLNELLHSAVVLPDSEVPLRLRSRIRELRWQMDALDQERSSRPQGRLPKLRTIDARVALADARARFAAIDSVDGSGAAKHAERILHFEVAMRRVAAPNDAALATLIDHIAWAPGTDLEAGPGNRGPPWLTDPPPSPARGGPEGGPTGRGPPASLPEQLNDAFLQELKATRSRDPLGRAQARARVATCKRLFSAALGSDGNSPLAALDAPQLDQLRDGYMDWRKALVRESTTSTSAELIIETKEADRYLREIAAEYSRRINPSSATGTAQVARALNLLGESPELSAVRSAYDVVYREELRQSLRLELDFPRAVPDPRVASAYEDAVVSSLRAEVAHINALWDEASGLEYVALRDGRGPEGARLGTSLVQAKRDLRSAGRELTQRISRTFAKGSPPEIPSLNPELARTTEVEVVDGSAHRAAMDLVEARAAARQVAESRGTTYLQVRGQDGQTQVGGFRDPPSSDGPPAIRETLEPHDYEKLFPPTENWTHDYKSLTEESIESLRRAPGGVIVDPTLAESLGRQIDEMRIDLNSNSLQMRSGSVWQVVSPRLDAETLRVAYAFVLDGRVAAVDLREPTASEFRWLIATARHARPASSDLHEEEVLENVLRFATSVHLHPCLFNTQIGRRLIDADQLVFDLLPIADIRRESDEYKSGVSLVPLREAYADDEAAAVHDSQYRQALFFKSILSARGVSRRPTDGITLRADFDFRVYRVPIRYRRSGEWFDRNQDRLKAVRSELSVLERFAICVGFCRAVRASHVANNFDVLASVECPPAITPRFTITKAPKSDPEAEAMLAKLLVLPTENQATERSAP